MPRVPHLPREKGTDCPWVRDRLRTVPLQQAHRSGFRVPPRSGETGSVGRKPPLSVPTKSTSELCSDRPGPPGPVRAALAPVPGRAGGCSPVGSVRSVLRAPVRRRDGRRPALFRPSGPYERPGGRSGRSRCLFQVRRGGIGTPEGGREGVVLHEIPRGGPVFTVGTWGLSSRGGGPVLRGTDARCPKQEHPRSKAPGGHRPAFGGVGEIRGTMPYPGTRESPCRAVACVASSGYHRGPGFRALTCRDGWFAHTVFWVDDFHERAAGDRRLRRAIVRRRDCPGRLDFRSLGLDRALPL
jgi:hypothetical protein